ncbi:MAG: hypothetical protein P1P87_10485 [Trueperaceae bacterium]|nr:hypothetical protein [Trueperaceae bacterium]
MTAHEPRLHRPTASAAIVPVTATATRLPIRAPRARAAFARARAAAALLALAAMALAPIALAHGWEEPDVERALAEADAIVAVAEAVQAAWTPAPGDADEPVAAPAEVRWWTWLQSRLALEGDAAVREAVAAHAPAWLAEAPDPAAAVGWWLDALGEVLAHAAARDVDDDARAAAAADLARPDLGPAAAARLEGGGAAGAERRRAARPGAGLRAAGRPGRGGGAMRRTVRRPGAWRGVVRAPLALGALLAPAAANAWTPGTFEAYCGDAAFWVSRDPDQATAAWYARPGDPDAPGDPGCRATEQVGWFETALAEALARLAREPFPVDPAPTRSGPVVADGGGTPSVRFYVRPTGGGYANTLRCLRPAADTLGVLSVDRDRIDALSRLSVPYVALHELVHVVQGAQPFETAICGAAYLQLWITEGTADAFATRWVRERFPPFAPPPFTSLGRNLMGLRSFSVALAAPDGDTAFTQLYSYRSSALFRFVAERWHAGDHGVWAEAMGVPAPAGNDGLAWLDQVLRDPAYGVRQPLALVFPSFLASYAGWGRADSDRWPHVGEVPWRTLALGACEQVTLSPTAPSARVGLAIEPIAGRCVQVGLAGVPSGAIASVEVEASAPGSVPACVHKAFTGEHQGTGEGTWVRTFQASAVVASGVAWTDTLVLARVPARPSDARDAHRAPKAFEVVFALQLATASDDGASVGPVQGAGNATAPGHHGLPMEPGEGDLGPGAALDPSRLLFGQQAPGGGLANAAFAASAGPGLGLVQLLEGDDAVGDDVGRSFGVSFGERALPVGSMGTFPAVLMGSDPGRAGLGGAIVDASGDGPLRSQVRVHAWTDDHVQLTVDGVWCYADELRPDQGCAVERRLETDVWLPFGDAWDTAAPSAASTRRSRRCTARPSRPRPARPPRPASSAIAVARAPSRSRARPRRSPAWGPRGRRRRAR